nr:hypothetical protein [Bacilli bacterium]
MERINEIIEGVKLYPKLNNQYINLSIVIDMKDSCRILFGEDDYQEFINKVKNNLGYRKDVIYRLNNHFNLINYILITNSTYDKWYYARFTENISKEYTLLYIENISNLNPKHFYADYIDLFGNKIVFSE